MRALNNVGLRIASGDGAGLVAAGLVAVLGAASSLVVAPVGWALLGASALLAVGSLRHLLVIGRVRRRNPCPGRLVDVGGYRVHVLAEGSGTPTVVWMAGGHAPGHGLVHLHRALRDTTRSILVDRPGTGWSDPGPFPRTQAAEADEVVSALGRAGEQGPFILVGHSFGGWLMANVARRIPDQVSALVLLDPTQPDGLYYLPGAAATPVLRRAARRRAILTTFGRHPDQFAKQLANPQHAAAVRTQNDCIDSGGVDVWGLDARPSSGWATYSAFAQLEQGGLGPAAHLSVVYDGDLGDLPVWLVTPPDQQATAASARTALDSTPDDELARMLRMFEAVRRRYLATSSAARHRYAPAGTTHNFPYEAPEFVVQLVGTIVENARTPPRRQSVDTATSVSLPSSR